MSTRQADPSSSIGAMSLEQSVEVAVVTVGVVSPVSGLVVFIIAIDEYARVYFAIFAAAQLAAVAASSPTYV